MIPRQDKLILYANFGSTEKDYYYRDQQGKCFICLDSYPQEDLRIDHCHESGLVRGLLCNACNCGLGMFKDKIATLKRAIWYLKLNHVRL